jgi:hypothetical protein
VSKVEIERQACPSHLKLDVSSPDGGTEEVPPNGRGMLRTYLGCHALQAILAQEPLHSTHKPQAA